MQTKYDYSYGVIPIYKIDNDWRVLVVQQYGSKGDLYWGFPKGHKEEGETDTCAAVRELKEETNITLTSLDDSRVFEQLYTFTNGEMHVKKKVIYYIGKAESEGMVLQTNELATAEWCSFPKARELLTHEGTRKMFDRVVAYVHKNPAV
ncbi:MAG: NUDIX domain-containing protein, partial [Candidatus Paceibacterota bacterium]